MSRHGNPESSYDSYGIFLRMCGWRNRELKGPLLSAPMELHETETGWWIVQGGECIGQLTWDEMLGSVAASTIPGEGRRRLYRPQWKPYHTRPQIEARSRS